MGVRPGRSYRTPTPRRSRWRYPTSRPPERRPLPSLTTYPLTRERPTTWLTTGYRAGPPSWYAPSPPNNKIMVERAMYWNNRGAGTDTIGGYSDLSLIHISEPTRLGMISYAVFCLKKKKKKKKNTTSTYSYKKKKTKIQKQKKKY